MIPRSLRLALLVVLLLSIVVFSFPLRKSSAADNKGNAQVLNQKSEREGPSNYDAFGASNKRAAAAAADQKAGQPETKAGHAIQIEPRLGVPTFFWASETGKGQAKEMSANPSQVKVDIESAARGHLGAYGSSYRLSESDVAAAKLTAVHDTGKGAVIAKFRQEIGGIEVFRDELNVIMNRELQLIALSGYLTGDNADSDLSGQGFSLQPVDALAKALSDLTGTSVDASLFQNVSLKSSAIRENAVSGQNAYLSFTRDESAAPQNFTFGDEPLRVKQVFYHLVEGYVPAYYVEADVFVPSTDIGTLNASGEAPQTELAYSYVISAVDGEVLFRNNLIDDVNNSTKGANALAPGGFTYRVWADPVTGVPYDTPAGNGPHPKSNATPDGLQYPFVSQTDVQLPNYPFSQNDPWLAPGATETVGNNVDAYLNLFSPDGFGNPTTTSPIDPANGDFRAQITAASQFLHTHSADVNPSTAESRQGAIQQLFYNVNFLHDWFYDAGFNETSGNAQTNNFGRGGLGNDSIKAQAQDFSGFNNANMLTPADGSRPRMRMYVFTSPADHFEIQSPAAIAGKTTIGLSISGPQTFDVTADIVVATFSNSPSSCTVTNAAALSGKIALFNFDNTDGTGCSFSTRIARLTTTTSASAILMAYTSGAPTVVANITGYVAANTKPVTTISWNTAGPIKTQLAVPTTVTARLLRAPDRDGAVDNQIVFHEWGHYISNRLIGNSNGLNTNYAGGLGEGWGDFTAMLALSVREEDTSTASNATWNGTYALATYDTSGVPFSGALNNGYYFGSRRYPYSTDMTKNPLTFTHIQNGVALPVGPPVAFGQSGASNSEVHNTGEVWTTMLWECYAALLRDTQGASPRLTFAEAQNRMKNYLVAAYKMTPSSPTLLEARDAVLAAAFAYDYNDGRLFAQAFAKRGAGLNAISPDRYSSTNIGVTEDFTSDGALTYIGASLDDSTDSCELDGYLDNNEKGLLTVTVRNTGFQNLFNTTATVSSSNPKVTFPSGAVINFPTSQPGQSVSASIAVAGSAFSGVETTDFTITIEDSGPPATNPITRHFFEYLNVYEVPAASATDNVEPRQTAWTLSSNPTFGPVAQWQRIKVSGGVNHVWHGTDPGAGSDEYLNSPVMTVDGSGSFNLQFDHSWGFEFDGGGNYDGGVIEMSVNGGAYTDIGTPAYNGTILNYSGDVNPLKGRPGFVANSGGNVHSSLTQAVAPGSTVRIRFRSASDGALGTAGWDVDNIAFTGVVETNFAVLIGETSLCNPPQPPSPATIQLTPATMPAGSVGTPYSVTLTPSGGTPAYSYAITPVVLLPGLVTNVVNGNLEFSGTPTKAGTYLLTVKTTDSASHQGSNNFTITINKGDPTITWNDPADITYGDALTSTQLNATASVPGALTYTPPAGTTLNAGANQTLSVNFIPTDTTNYNGASKNVQINVLKATPIITWNDPADITYGTALGNTQLNASASVPGTLTYTPPSGTVLNAGANQNLQADFMPTDTVNYNPASKTVQINVLKATPTITWSNPADITYGMPLGATQLNAIASMPGTLTYEPVSGTILNAGAGQTLTVNFVPTDAVNYNNASKNVTINVLKATPVINWSNPADITYGTALNATQLNASAPVAGAFTYTPPATTILLAAPNQNLSVNFAPTDTANYRPTSQSVSINVLKATPVITWSNPADITFGTALGSTQLNATASVPGSFNYVPSLGTLLGVGNNQILTVSFAPTDSANYTTTIKTVTINTFKANQAITFDALPSKTYGDAPFTLSATSSSNLPVSFMILSGPATISGNTVTITGAGSVTVRASQAGDGSYNAAPAIDLTFNVANFNANIALSDLSYIYDGTAKFATVTTNPAGLNITVSYSQNATSVASPTNAGTYSMTATINSPNYQGTMTGTLVINKATPVLTWANPSNISYGTPLSGTQLNAAANVPGTLQYNLPAGTVLSPGTYQLLVTFTPSDTTNYNSVTTSVQLTVDVVPVQFSSATYSVIENVGSVIIVVQRTGNLSLPATVDYETQDGTASDRGDYDTARGTLHFAAGQTTDSFFVMINDDAYLEGNEDFQVRLTNATVGVGLGIPSTATVTITDNDTTAPVANTTDDIDDFVRQLYHDFLDREPEADGFNYWTNILRGCPDDACLNSVRVEIASRFFQELEFQQTGYFVMRLYKAAYGRFPTYLEFVKDRHQVMTTAESQRAFAEEFVQRPAFTAIYGSLNNQQFVDQLFDTANLKPYASERQAQVSLLQGGKSRAQVLEDLVDIGEFRTREFNPAFVRMMYFGFLRRDAEVAGEAYWLNVINNLTPNNYRGMICAFLNSAEYQQRFSSVRGKFTELSCQ